MCITWHLTFMANCRAFTFNTIWVGFSRAYLGPPLSPLCTHTWFPPLPAQRQQQKGLSGEKEEFACWHRDWDVPAPDILASHSQEANVSSARAFLEQPRAELTRAELARAEASAHYNGGDVANDGNLFEKSRKHPQAGQGFFCEEVFKEVFKGVDD